MKISNTITKKGCCVSVSVLKVSLSKKVWVEEWRKKGEKMQRLRNMQVRGVFVSTFFLLFFSGRKLRKRRDEQTCWSGAVFRLLFFCIVFGGSNFFSGRKSRDVAGQGVCLVGARKRCRKKAGEKVGVSCTFVASAFFLHLFGGCGPQGRGGGWRLRIAVAAVVAVLERAC